MTRSFSPTSLHFRAVARVAWIVLVTFVVLSCGGGGGGGAPPTGFESCGGVDDPTAVSASLECVARSEGLAYAVWKYETAVPGNVTIPLGAANRFSPAPRGRGQPIAFEGTGRVATLMTEATLAWTLGASTAVALRDASKACPSTTTEPSGRYATVDGGIKVLLSANETSAAAGAIVDTDAQDFGSGPNGAPDLRTPGRLPGNFAVSSDGASTYSIPLWVPAGRAGMQPDLALTYNSRGGNGPLGVGWSLSGLSQITRCARTMASDKEARAIEWNDAIDRFCLDGDFLIPVSAAGAGDGELRPEHDPFTRVTIVARDTLGPTSFTVFRRDGRIQRYGVGAESRLEGRRVGWTANPNTTHPATPLHMGRVRYAWMVAEIEDRSGNGMYVRYEDVDADACPPEDLLAVYPCGVELRPKYIDYTYRRSDPILQGGRRATARQIVFEYDRDRPDPEHFYVSGLPLRNYARLSAIKMYAPNPESSELVRKYELAYAQGEGNEPAPSITGRSLLASIRECDKENVCKPPTRFEWEKGSLLFDDVPIGSHAAATFDKPHWGLIAADVNGDGRDDILYRKVVSRRSHQGKPDSEILEWYLRLSTGTGFGPEQPSGLPREEEFVGFALPMPRVLDIDGDGRADIAIAIRRYFFQTDDINEMHFWRFYRFVGSSYVSAGYPDAPEREGCWLDHCTQLPATLYAGDMNGDGLPEVLHRYEPPAATLPSWGIRHNVGGTLAPSYVTLASEPGPFLFVQGHNSYFADIDASGRTSLLLRARLEPHIPDVANVGTRLMSVAMTGTSGAITRTPTTLLADNHYLFLDLNGDGLADAVHLSRSLPQFPRIAVNTGNGFPNAEEAVEEGPNKIYSFSFGALDRDVRVMDVNQDGRPDLVLVGEADGKTAFVNSSMLVYETKYRRGSQRPMLEAFKGHGALATTGPGGEIRAIPAHPFGSPNLAFTQTLDVDGDGMLDLVRFDGTQLRLHRRLGKRPDQIVRIHDGLGARTEISYASVTTRTGGAFYPRFPVGRGVSVVDGYRIDSGKDSATGPVFNAYKLEYFDPLFDTQGRGWLGFGRRVLTDLQLGTRVSTFFDNVTRRGTSYPFAGLPEMEVVTVDLDSGVRFESTTRYEYEIHGAVDTGQPFSVKPRRVHRLERETPGAVLLSIITTYAYDAFDNVTRATERAELDNVTNETVTTYRNLEDRWLLGLPDVVTVSSSVGAPIVIMRERRTRYVHDESTGLLISTEIEPGGTVDERRITTFVRNRDGLLVAIQDADASGSGSARETSYAYDEREGIFLTRMTNPLGHSTLLAFHPGLGVLSHVVAPNGARSAWRYDRFGRVRAEEQAGGETNRYAYRFGSGGPILEAEHATGGRSVFGFDRLGRIRTKDFTTLTGALSRRRIEYDRFFLEKPSTISQPFYLTAISPPAASFTYDRRGRLLVQTMPGGGSLRHSYRGRQTLRIDATGNRSLLVEDSLGRVVSSTQTLLGLFPRDLTTTYEYGPFDVLERTTDPAGNRTSYVYDTLGRLIEHRDPDAGTNRYAYNAFGDTREIVDGNGSVTTIGLDALGRTVGTKRVKASTTPGTSGDELTCLYWDNAPNGVGQLASSVSADGTRRSLEYDSSGRPTKWRWNIDGEDFASEAAYDAVGRIAEVRYPAAAGESLTIQHGYHPVSGHLERVTLGTKEIWRLAGEDASGRSTLELTNNGVATTTAYDANGMVTRLRSVAPGKAAVVDLQYEYRVDAKVRSRRDLTVPASAINGGYEEYRYDSLHRVTAWEKPGRWSVSYDYDLVGNLERSVRDFGPPPSRVVNYQSGAGGAGPHALTSASGSGAYTYDKAGNQISAPGRTSVEYTSFRLPRRIDMSSGAAVLYKYDAGGVRVGRDAGTEKTTYVGELYERRVGPAGTQHVFSIWAKGQVVAQIVREHAAGGAATSTLYIHRDALGSPVAITRDDHATTGAAERHRFDPFGRPVATNDPTVSAEALSRMHVGFTGHESEGDLGLVNMRGRIYDSRTSRFLTPDPFVQFPFTAQSFNRYAYVLNNPLNLVDPSGFEVPGGGKGGAGTSFGAPAGASGWSGAYPGWSTALARKAGHCIGQAECRAVAAMLGSSSGGPGRTALTSDNSGVAANQPGTNAPTNAPSGPQTDQDYQNSLERELIVNPGGSALKVIEATLWAEVVIVTAGTVEIWGPALYSAEVAMTQGVVAAGTVLRFAGQRFIDSLRRLASDTAGALRTPNFAAWARGRLFQDRAIAAIPGAAENKLTVIGRVPRPFVTWLVKTIPDIMDTGSGFMRGHLVEFKDTLVVSFTRQLEAQRFIAEQNGLPWYVIVNGATYVTAEVMRQAASSGGGVFIFNMATGTFRPYP